MLVFARLAAVVSCSLFVISYYPIATSRYAVLQFKWPWLRYGEKQTNLRMNYDSEGVEPVEVQFRPSLKVLRSIYSSPPLNINNEIDSTIENSSNLEDSRRALQLQDPHILSSRSHAGRYSSIGDRGLQRREGYGINMSHHHKHNKFLSKSKDIDYIDIAAISCMGTHLRLIPSWLMSIRRACIMSSHRIRVSVFGDHYAKSYIEGFPNAFDKIYDDINFQVFNIEQFLNSSWNQKLGNRWSCTAGKLNLLNMMPEEVKRVIYLDLDMIILEDLANLWAETYKIPEFNSEYGIYFIRQNMDYAKDYEGHVRSFRNVNENRSNYTVPIFMFTEECDFNGEVCKDKIKSYASVWGNAVKSFPPANINSGTLVINLAAARELGITPELLLENMDEIGPRATLGEQPYIENWAYHNKDKVVVLPCRWNHGIADGGCEFNTTGPLKGNRGIFHGPNGFFLKEGWYFPQPYNEEFDILNAVRNKSLPHLAYFSSWQ